MDFPAADHFLCIKMALEEGSTEHLQVSLSRDDVAKRFASWLLDTPSRELIHFLEECLPSTSSRARQKRRDDAGFFSIKTSADFAVVEVMPNDKANTYHELRLSAGTRYLGVTSALLSRIFDADTALDVSGLFANTARSTLRDYGPCTIFSVIVGFLLLLDKSFVEVYKDEDTTTAHVRISANAPKHANACTGLLEVVADRSMVDYTLLTRTSFKFFAVDAALPHYREVGNKAAECKSTMTTLYKNEHFQNVLKSLDKLHQRSPRDNIAGSIFTLNNAFNTPALRRAFLAAGFRFPLFALTEGWVDRVVEACSSNPPRDYTYKGVTDAHLNAIAECAIELDVAKLRKEHSDPATLAMIAQTPVVFMMSNIPPALRAALMPPASRAAGKKKTRHMEETK